MRASGQYDNSGYNFRGYLLTDSTGAYHLETVVPGLYPGRTEHIHVKVQAPDGPTLTTQLFFPGVAQNQSDGIYDARNLVSVQSSTAEKMSATFTFIIKTP
jgi:protocatechuate 3,4-dioxygenase beta subunit